MERRAQPGPMIQGKLRPRQQAGQSPTVTCSLNLGSLYPWLVAPTHPSLRTRPSRSWDSTCPGALAAIKMSPIGP